MNSPVGHLWHLVRRFGGSLSPAAPAAADDIWARSHLLPGEETVWARMSNPDRRHAIGVARQVVERLGSDAGPEVVAAALLHDSGKVIAGLGTFSRVGATLVWAVAPDRAAGTWAASRVSVVRRLGQYRLHPELGSALLTEAGSHHLTSAWAREHHLGSERWSVPLPLAEVLKACDDD